MYTLTTQCHPTSVRGTIRSAMLRTIYMHSNVLFSHYEHHRG
jgi:hypothetical protein